MTTMISSVAVDQLDERLENGNLSEADLFTYKARECKSAPARAFEDPPASASTSRSCSSCSSINSPERRQRKRKNTSLCWTWKKLMYFFFCHAPEFTNWTTSFSSTSRIKYLTLFYLEAFFRSVGEVQFCGNPFSGLLIFIGMLISSPQIAFLAFVTLTFGIETSVVLLRYPLSEVRSGVVNYNTFLTGSVVGMLSQNDVLLAFPDIILMCIVIGILTPFIWKGLCGLLVTRLEFPLVNSPFHIMILIYMFSGMSERYKAPIASQVKGTDTFPLMIGNSTENLNVNNHVDFINIVANGTSQSLAVNTSPPPMNSLQVMNTELDWEKVFYGIYLAPSHVFATNDLATSMLVYIGVLLYSPVMLVQSVSGATIGTIIGIWLGGPQEYEMIYDGSWAYNPLYTAAGLGGFYLVINTYSWILAIVGAILTTLMYSVMIKIGIPPLGIPLMLGIWLLLPAIPLEQHLSGGSESETLSEGPFIRLRLSQLTTPELHRALLTAQKSNRDGPTNKYESEASTVNPSGSMNSILPL